MFHVGDYIVYGSNGICRVEEITHPDIAGIDEDKLYYVLVPEKTRDSRLFCPTDNSRGGSFDGRGQGNRTIAGRE